MEGRAWKDSGVVLFDFHGGCRQNSALSAARGWGRAAGSSGAVATTASGGDLAPSTGASSPGQVKGSVLRRYIKAAPEYKNFCLRQLLWIKTDKRTVALATNFRQYDTIIFFVFSSLRIPGFHCCCGAGWWMGENKSVTFLCVKFISAYFSHAYVHMHARQGLTKHFTSFRTGCMKECTCTVLPASVPEIPYVLACELKISR